MNEYLTYLRRWYHNRIEMEASLPPEISMVDKRCLVSSSGTFFGTPRKRWTEEDMKFLRENYLLMSHEELAYHLTRTVWAVGQELSRNRLLKKK